MPKRVRVKMLPRRYDPEFMEFFKKHVYLEDGVLKTRDCYAHLGFNLHFKNSVWSVTYANAVWFLTRGEWPKPGYHIDHINDDSLDNHPDNLQELTPIENQSKKRGKRVYRSYGKGKYGYGMSITYDKRDGCYYIGRNISRGFGAGDLKGVKISLGREETLEAAKNRVNDYIEEIKLKGLGYVPQKPTQRPKKATLILDAKTVEMRRLREQGLTFQQIANKLGMRMGAVYKRTRDVVVGS